MNNLDLLKNRKWQKSVHSGLIFPETQLYISSYQDCGRYNAIGSSTPVKDWRGIQNLSLRPGVDQSSFYVDDYPFYAFDGINDSIYILSAGASHLEIATFDWCIWGWFSAGEDTGTVQNIMSMRHGSAGIYWRLYLDNGNGILKFNISSTSGAPTTQDLNSNNNFQDGWHFFCIVLDRDVGIDFYLDDTIRNDHSSSWTDLNSDDITTDLNFAIGARDSGDLHFYEGSIGEISVIRNKVLTSNEVTFLYENSLYNRLQ